MSYAPQSVYVISGFSGDDAPHWDEAFIEAESEAAARAILSAILSDEKTRPDTLWATSFTPSAWRVREANRPLRFVLGGGCR